uniref:two-partner secretion domain-containing protein n=1 Tax=Luteimonas huabeiensis TaxID=1244513 RepID=UPI0004677CB7
MNRIYRLVFNRALGQVQAVAEVASRRRGAAAAGGRAGAPGKSVLCAALLAAAGQAAAQAPGALDLPTGGNIVGGSASITPGHGSLEIVQNGRTVIDWSTFDIGSDASVRFTQSGGSIALNRILDGDASQILGKLDATATIFLINPNGLLFGEGAQVNVGGLVASTLSPVAAYPGAPDPIQDFLQGSPSMTLAIGPNAQGAIVNRGALRGGQIALVGGYVENAAGATIQADGGRAGLYAADGVQLTLGWGSVSGVTIQQAVQNALQATLVNNLGRIQAVGGSAILGARGRVGTVSAAINTEGVIEASDIALTGSGGQLRAGGDIAAGTSLSLSSGDAQAYLDGDIEAGSLSLYARDIQQGGGALAVRGTAVLEASQDIDLSRAGNDFGGRVDAAGRNVDLVSGSDLRIGDLDVRGNLAVDSLGAVSFAGGTVAGALDVEAAGIAQTGALTVRDGSAFDAGSHDIDLRHAGNAFGGDVDIVAQDASLGSSTGLRFGSLDARGNLTVASQGGVSFAGGTVGGALEVVAGGSIGQSGALTVRGAATFDAGSHGILLNQAGNDFVGTVDILGAGVVVMADANALTFGQVDAAVLDVASGGDLTFGATTLSGALAARSAGGGIRQDGAASIGGEISLSAGEIAFDHADNRLQGPVWLSGGNVRIRDRTALRFGAVDVGSLQATAPELWLAADMRSDGLQFYVGDVRLAQDTRIASTLGDVDIRGTLDGAHALEVTAAGNVFFRTAVGATAALERLDVGAGRIHLGGDVATGGDQIYRSAVSLGGSVALASADGGIAFQSTVDGAHALSARAADVAFGGAIGSASAGALAALTVDSGTFAAAGSVAVAGDLRLTVAQGGIGQAAAWTIGGASALDAGGGDIVLTQAGNDFRGTVDLAGDAVRIHDANALTLGRLATGALTASSGGALGLGQGLVGGALSATSAAGGIGQSGALTVTGDAALDAGSGDILLTQAGNDFATVSVAGIDARLSDDNEIRLTGIDATDLHVRAQTIRLDLDTVATGGDQTYAGRLVLERDTALSSDAGSLSFQAVDGSAQRMTARAAQGAVDFGGAVQLRELDAASATFRAGGPLATAGALAIATTAGGIGQNGAWTVGGSADLRASGGIALRDGGNDFSGPVRLESGQGVALHDAGDLTIAGLATGAGHGVHLEAGGALALPEQAIDTGDGALTLVAGGTLSTAGALSGGALTLHGAGGVVLAHDVAAGDELTLSSTHGDVAQTGGSIHAGGTTTAEAGGDIRLAAAGNDFVGA